MLRLPIDEQLDAIASALTQQRNLVLVAEPGAGKTTRVAPALVRQKLTNKRTLLTQPRRVAVRAVTARIADENGWTVGGEVGYQVRFEKRSSNATRLDVVTDGILRRRLQADPFIESTGIVILDEFHERAVGTDLCLAMLREVQQSVREDLRIIVMSATLDAEPVAQFLDCEVLRCGGRLFPVTVHFAKKRDERPLESQVAHAVHQAFEQTNGDVLTFVPGRGEIARCQDYLTSRIKAPVMPLHGGLALAEQIKVLTPSDQRRVVLATNIAETSLTIPGVTAVIDSGLVRQSSFDARFGFDRLDTKSISVASAQQRSGRAGRTENGAAWRLWTENQHARLQAFDEPEIHRSDLSPIVLELRAWGAEPGSFAFFDAPAAGRIDEATVFLQSLGALDSNGSITRRGRILLSLPLPPRLGMLAIAAAEAGVPELGAAATALLAEPHHKLAGESLPASSCDLLVRIAHGIGGKRIKRAAAQVERALGQQNLQSDRPADEHSQEKAFRRAVLAAYGDRVAMRRVPRGARAKLATGQGIKLSPNSTVKDAELFVALSLHGRGSEATAELATAVDRAWLPTTLEQSTFLDPDSGRVRNVQRTCYRSLILDERPASPDPEVAAKALADAVEHDWRTTLRPSDDTMAWLNRLQFARKWLDPALPSIEQAITAALPELCYGKTSLAELRKASLVGAVQNRLSHDQLRAIDDHVPSSLKMPSGRRARVQYDSDVDKPPVVAVQLQNLFGMAESPRIARGQVGVLLHLLAPNQRPVQITQDLRSFWNETYTEVRKELRQRYPRHAWPEDPWNSPPQSRPQRRKKR